MELEPHAYGPGATREESEAIANRVSVVDGRILFLHEMAVQSAFSVNLMFDRIESLARDWDRFAYIVDLTEAKRPDPETRAALKAARARHQPSRSARRDHRRRTICSCVQWRGCLRMAWGCPA